MINTVYSRIWFKTPSLRIKIEIVQRINVKQTYYLLIFQNLLTSFNHFSVEMSQSSSKNSHLTHNQSYLFKYQLSTGLTHQQIIETWDEEFHHRKAPSIQIIYKIKRLVDKGVSVEKWKSWPKNKTVLTPDKLDETNVIDENPFLVNESIGNVVTLPKWTVFDGLKIIGMEKYEVIKIINLTEDHREQRISFCNYFLFWNIKYQSRVWWSDESTFKVEELLKYTQKSYYATENIHLKIEKKRKKWINVWSAIRGDGKVVYQILEGQNSEKYIQILISKFQEMEANTSFLMQDGGRHHSLVSVEWLNNNWKDRCIGIGSKRLSWPPYSHDLTPMDFSFWSLG